MPDLRPGKPIVSPIGGRPPGLEAHRDGNVIWLRYRWRRFDHVVLIAASAASCVMALLVTLPGPTELILPIRLMFVLIGIGGAYTGACGLRNRTLVTSDDAVLKVSHGPLPLFRNALVHRHDLLQLFIRNRWPGSGGASLYALLEDGRQVRLLVCSPDTAIWLERQLEEHWGVVHREVICPSCGYDLRMTLRVCPECGRPLTENKHIRRRWRDWMRSRSPKR